MTFLETKQETKWFSLGALLVVLAFTLFLGKMGYLDHLNGDISIVNNATFESNR